MDVLTAGIQFNTPMVLGILVVEAIKRIPQLGVIPDAFKDVSKFILAGLIAAGIVGLQIARGEVDPTVVGFTDGLAEVWKSMLFYYTGFRIITGVRNRLPGSSV